MLRNSGAFALAVVISFTVEPRSTALFNRPDRDTQATANPTNAIQSKFLRIFNSWKAKTLGPARFIGQGTTIRFVNTSLSKTLVLPEVTIRPKVTFVAMVNVLVLTVTHVEPFVEARALITFPVRANCSQ